MNGAIPPLPNTRSCSGALLSTGTPVPVHYVLNIFYIVTSCLPRSAHIQINYVTGIPIRSALCRGSYQSLPRPPMWFTSAPLLPSAPINLFSVLRLFLQSTPPNRSPPLNVGSSQCVSTHRPGSVLPVQPTCGRISGLLRPLVDISTSRPHPFCTHPHCLSPKIRKEPFPKIVLWLLFPLVLQFQDAILQSPSSKFPTLCSQWLGLTNSTTLICLYCCSSACCYI
jgi:hypothetical protein